MSLTTPVAFLIFNRPDLTEKVFNEIAKAKPKKLLVVADGPRNKEDAVKCQQVRAVIEKVDWECEVSKNYSDVNLGCRKRVSSGIDWVFSQVEEAIILEDDCLPAPSFFYFCQSLLEYYRNDTRIFCISGNNFQFNNSRTNYTYYFSKYTHIWGWATWRRAWKHYDEKMSSWPDFKKSDLLRACSENIYERYWWSKFFESTYNGLIDTWDYQWLYTCWTQNGLTVIPNVNLVSNIGVRHDSTHKINHKLAYIPVNKINHINHPEFIIRNQMADQFSLNNIFEFTFINLVRSKLSLSKIIWKIRNLISE